MSPRTRSSQGRGATPARRAAFEVLRRTFEHDAWTDRALRSAAERHGLAGRDLAFAQRLAYGAVQRRGTSDHLVERLAGRPPAELDKPLLAALRLGLYELLFTAPGHDHAAVSQAVELAKGGMRAGGRGGRAHAATGLVNAVLRRAAREREELLAGLGDGTAAAAAVAHSIPLWVAELWWRELGAHVARALMREANEPAERALRANTLRCDPAELTRRLRAAGEPVLPGGSGDQLLAPREAILTTGRWGEALRASLAGGELVAQSRASQAVVGVLAPRAGERVLDLCAGPGIKSTAIAARMGDRGAVRSIEIDPGRAAEVAELCARLGASCVASERADATQADLRPGYDRVLVDPPCTDLGALASRPDARWRKTPEQSARLSALQKAILGRAADALRPGGTLVYSTCTIARAENEDVVTSVLRAKANLAADELGAEHPRLASPHDGRFLATRPDRDHTDGFFIARLRRMGA